MTRRSQEITRAVRSALMVSAIAATSVTTLPVVAQETSASEVETITVTGTRIRRVDSETADPVFVVDSNTIAASGATNIGDIIQRIPAIAGGATNPQANNGGGFGESNISLRGLGGFGPNVEPRTLILLDGRRVGLIGASGSVDVNVIPASIVERVEVLKEGAGAVYGSDAIAGVVNFITKKNIDGVEAGVQYNETSRSDGRGRTGSLTFGSHTDKLSFTFGGSYTNQDGISAARRDFSKNSLGLYSGSVIIGGSSRNQLGRMSLNATGLPPAAQAQENALKAQYGCSSVVRKPGTQGTALTDYRCFNSSADNFNFQPFNNLLTPQERGALFTTLNYTFNDYVEAYAEVLYSRTRSGFQIAPLPFDTQADDVIISKNSLYNPFGIDFGGLTSGNPNATTRTTALGNRFSETTGDSKLLYAGLRGKIPTIDWDWDLGAEYGRLDQIANINGYLFLPLAKEAFGPSAIVNGVPTCLDAGGAAIAGCTPVSFFAINDPSQQTALKSLIAGYSTDNTYVTRSATLDFTGKIVDLPAGALQGAVGFDYRWQQGLFTRTYDSVAVAPLFLSCQLNSETCGGLTAGHYSQKEAYVETLAPLLKDLPGVKSLNLSAGVRYSDYSNFGSTTKSQFKLEYKPINDLLVRGTWAQIFRAPSVNDLFNTPTTNAAVFTDPCVGLTAATLASNPNYAKVCKFVPTDGSFQAANTQVTGLLAGNPKLRPESGDVLTYGLVYDSSLLPGFSANVDFWRYQINNVITQVDPNFAATQCLTTGADQFCGLFARQPSTGQILVIDQPTSNLGKLKTEGVDLGLRYTLRNTGIGSWNFAIDATRLKDFESTPAPGAPTADITGTYNRQFGNFAKWRAFANIGWTLQGFEGVLTARYIGGVSLAKPDAGDPAAPGFVVGPLKVPAFTYVDATVGYTFPTKTHVQFGVTNIGDKQPPIMYSNNVLNSNTDVQTYDTLGRRFFLSVQQKF
ncbi:MAG: TonB-dependent receptor, partial [Gammaproteobacteria bacterium]|jgi:iron complex outermembrane receptor protein|nr:TonB-dependent receptor [Gammaproteobacteria bacterium]